MPGQVGLRHVEPVMGTVVTIDVRDPSIGQGAVLAVTRWLHTVDATFSTYRDDSAISRLDQGTISLEDCPETVAIVLDLCDELTKRTNGYFDVCYADHLDPSGVVKGWAVDQADAILRAAGSGDHLINAGGDILMAGTAGADSPWRVGVIDPFDRTRLAAVVAGTDLAVATSGVAERGLHVVDPHTRQAVKELASVTVIGSDLTHADAYATAGLAMGRESPTWLDTLTGFEAFVVFADGSSWCTRGFHSEVSVKGRELIEDHARGRFR
ncbi:FAD:protein FMN transferase [Actinopolymorpha pittospori]|uniref:FAD:protein FMN transferase n=1 Tax=Actinopolymorpha pittospori TaxID=648752 RepID=A0A927R5I5_9ACTN|nr:FAD:protein FMN transferase [Actinopolymorpha pittospori]MBE1603332.1 thiamine biosynthesis lipoprotein [Actinopolymorpha pittospori]